MGSFLSGVSYWGHILTRSQNDESLTLSLGKLINLILLSEVNLVNWFLDLALECVFEGWDLIMLGKRVSWKHVGSHASTQLVVRVKIHLFLQLPPDVLVVVRVRSQMLIQLVIWLTVRNLASLSFLLFLSLHRLLQRLLLAILIVNLFALLIELDNQVVLLGISERNVISLHFYFPFC